MSPAEPVAAAMPLATPDAPEPATVPAREAAAPAQAARGRLGVWEWLLLAATATAATPLYANPIGDATLRSCDLLVLLAAGAWLVDRLRGRAAPLVRTALDLPLLALGLALVASVAVAEQVLPWAKALRPWAFAFAFFHLLSAHLRDAAAAGRVLALSLVGLGAQLAVALWQIFAGERGMRLLLDSAPGRLLYQTDVTDALRPDFFFNWAMPADDPLRPVLSMYPAGTAVNATVFAAAMAALSLLLVCWPTRGRRAGALALAGAAAAALVLFLTFKRTGWFVFLAVLPLAVLAGGRRALLRGAVALLAVAALYGAIWAAMPRAGRSFAGRAASVAGELAAGRARPDARARWIAPPGPATDSAANGEPGPAPVPSNARMQLWKRAAELLARNPGLGVGAGQWQFYSPWVETRRGLVQWGNPESSLVGIAVETGVPGLAGFLAMLGVLVALGARLWRRGGAPGALAATATVGLIVLAAASAVNDLFTDDKIWPLFFAWAAVVTSLHRLRAAAPPAAGPA